MPVENSWLIENRVMLTRLSGHVTIDDLVQNAREGTLMIESGIKPVYSLVDASGIEQFPLRLNQMHAVSEQGSSDKLDWIIIYGIPNRFISFLATTFVQVIQKRYKVVGTLDEAMAFVNSREPHPIG
jgi:hypothetical protein